jgi:hypothetical protein
MPVQTYIDTCIMGARVIFYTVARRIAFKLLSAANRQERIAKREEIMISARIYEIILADEQRVMSARIRSIVGGN